MNYKEEHIAAFSNNLESSDLRLDEDEKNQSFFLLHRENKQPLVHCIDYVECIHLNTSICDIMLIPSQFRQGLLRIIEPYTLGYCTLEGKQWASIERPSELQVSATA